MIFRTPLLLALLWLPAVAVAQDTLRVSLSDALVRAMEISPDIRMAEANASFAEARLDQARRSRLLPEARASSAHAMAPGIENPNGTPIDRLYLDPDVRNDWNVLAPYSRVDFDLVQPLWTWGQIGRSIDAARAGVLVEEGAVGSKRLEVGLRTGQLYYSVLLLSALDRLTDEASEAVERARTEVEKQLADGAPDVDDADLFQVQITEQEIRRRIVQVRQEALTARSGLRRQLMLPERTVVDTQDRLLEPLPLALDSLEHYQALALAHRPELAQTRAGIEARDALVDVARSEYFPKLYWGFHSHYSFTSGRYRQRNPFVGDSFLSRSAETGLVMRLSLNFALTRSKVGQARAQAREVRHQDEAARELVLFEVEEAYRRVRVLEEAVVSLEDALRISRTWLQTEYLNFDLDLGDTDNLIKAVQANLELQAQRHQTVFDLNVAVLTLHAAVGGFEPILAY